MSDKNQKVAIDFSNLLMQMNQKIPTIGFNDEGKAEAIFIEARGLIKKHFGEEHGYYKDYLRVRQLKGAYTFHLSALLSVMEVIANKAKEDYLDEIEEYQRQIVSDSEKNASSTIPWKELDKLERKYRKREPLGPRLAGLFQNISQPLFDAHNRKVIFLILLGIGLCTIPLFINAIPDWLAYVSGIIVAIVSILFTMNRREK